MARKRKVIETLDLDYAVIAFRKRIESDRNKILGFCQEFRFLYTDEDKMLDYYAVMNINFPLNCLTQQHKEYYHIRITRIKEEFQEAYLLIGDLAQKRVLKYIEMQEKEVA